MAEEIYTFSEEGMRKLVASYRAQQQEMSNLRRHLAHYSTRRHEAVYLPGSAVKIISSTETLYAAFGGTAGTSGDYANVESNALAISTGNYVPLSSGSEATQRKRVTYARTCHVWERDSAGVLTDTEEELEAFNPGSLPIPAYVFCYADKCHTSDTWVITGLVNPHDSGSRYFRMSGASTIVAGNQQAKINRTDSWTDVHPSGSPETDWAHKIGPDVYIHHPGTYEITYGAEVQRYSSDTADDITWTDSRSDTVDLPSTMNVEVDLIQNHNLTNITSGWPINNERLKFTIPGGTSRGVTAERTFLVEHTLDTWHGYPYMRLSLAIYCRTGNASSEARLNEGWINIRPCGGGTNGGNHGSGYNAFLGTSGAFNWHGGGTAPAGGDFGESGT